MKPLSFHPVPKLAQNLTGGGKSLQLVDNSTFIQFHRSRWLRPRITKRSLVQLTAASFFLILSLFSFSAHAGIISTLAGTGTAGSSGDGGAATSAQLNSPSGVAVDSSGNLYIADRNNHSIRKVTSGGIISTVAGTGAFGYSGDFGAATSAQLDSPRGVAVDSSGNLYIADFDNHSIRKVTSGGIISTVAGTGTWGSSGDDGAATSAQLDFPTGIAVDSSGNLYIADANNNRIRKVTSGIISTVAGTGAQGYSGDGGAATSAQLQYPYGVAVDSSGNLYIADRDNHRIRKVTSGIISTVAGTGAQGYSGDGGAATSAQLQYPYGVAVDSSGNLYIADRDNHRIRKVTSGIISTVAGTGAQGYSGDGGAATSAQLQYPYGVAVDSSGNLYIADRDNHRLRKVTPAPTINVQGNSTSIVSGDTTPTTTDNTDFGSTPVGTPVSQTFTINNIGELPLNLSGSPIVSVTGSGFSVTTQPTSPVAAFTGTTNLVIQFASTVAGVSNGTVSIANNDSLNNPYTFSITGTGNTAPTANNGSLTTNEDTAGSGTVTAADANGDSLTYSLVTNGTKGTATITNTSTGTYTYTPSLNQTGTDTFTFKANDGTADSNEATITITITPSVTPPPPPPPPPLVEVPPPIPSPRTLHLTLAGTGQGGVISDPVGLECSATSSACALTFDWPQWVHLITTPATDSIFSGWTGDPACTQDSPDKVLLLQDTTCTATFDLKFYTLTVERNVPGVTITGDGLDCQETPQGFRNLEGLGNLGCVATYPYGTTVTLQASDAPLEWEFVGWGGSCDRQGQVTITRETVCRAKYQEDPKIPALGDGNGDGLLDAHQPNVMSLADKMLGSYITLETKPDCVVADGSTVTAETLGGADPNHPTPQGLMAFELQCSQTPVTMYFHGFHQLLRNLEFLKYGPKVPGDPKTVGWYTLPNVTFKLVTLGGKPVVAATYTLTDGQFGDNTGVDGRIVDPGGIMVK